MMDNLLRRSCRPMDITSTPSITMDPSAGSTNLKRATPKVDLPTHTKHLVSRVWIVILIVYRGRVPSHPFSHGLTKEDNVKF